MIAALQQSELGNKHFSKWDEKSKKVAIQKCGLAHSNFSNKASRNEILQHLSTTPLPTDHGEVLRMILELGLPPSGATSKQQFSFFLLSYLCDKMKFPPWEPIPIVEIIAPTSKQLVDTTRRVVLDRMFEDQVPFIYKGQRHSGVWSARRQV